MRRQRRTGEHRLLGLRKTIQIGLLAIGIVQPRMATAEILSDLLECAALFDVLDVGQMDDPVAFRSDLDAASTLFADVFRSFHGNSLTERLRLDYQENWQAKPATAETAEELAAALRFCEREADLRGVPIGVAEQRLQGKE